MKALLGLVFVTCANAYALEDRALLIGISQYSEINSLRYADADVRSFYQLLTEFGGYKESNVDLLLNQHATKAAISAKIQRIIDDSEKNPLDHFILVFAGHGLPGRINGEATDLFLAPFDASTKDNNFFSNGTQVANETFIDKAWLARQLSAIHANSIIVILDSCYSGTKDFGTLFLSNMGYSVRFYGSDAGRGIAVEKRSAQIINSGEKARDWTPPTSRKVAYLASSREDQVSTEYDQLEHGALSYCIFEYVRSVQRDAYADERKSLTVRDLYSNITRLFHEVEVNGAPLDKLHQPFLLAIPDDETVLGLEFASIHGTKAREGAVAQLGVLDVTTDLTDTEVLVDGEQRAAGPASHLNLIDGKHLIEVYIPSTGYRYSFTSNISHAAPVAERVAVRGSLDVESYWLQNGKKIGGPKLEVFIDGRFQGNSELHMDNLIAGTHLLEVRYKDVTKSRRIEIRPDSPLRVKYLLVREEAPLGHDDKGVGTVIF
jgi:hypothetical protein